MRRALGCARIEAQLTLLFQLSWRSEAGSPQVNVVVTSFMHPGTCERTSQRAVSWHPQRSRPVDSLHTRCISESWTFRAPATEAQR